MGTREHLLGLCIVTADTLFGHIRGLGVLMKFDKLVVVRDILLMAARAA